MKIKDIRIKTKCYSCMSELTTISEHPIPEKRDGKEYLITIWCPECDTEQTMKLEVKYEADN